MTTEETHYILMIEDDADDRYLTEMVFREHGYEVDLDFLSCGENVIEYLSKHSEAQLPSLILLDRSLPAVDGMDILRSVKQHPSFRYIPVVMISGTAAAKVVEESYDNGANSFFQKPATNQLTSDRIRVFLQYWFDIVDLPLRRKLEPQLGMF